MKFAFFILGILVLFVVSDFIYVYKNEPNRLGKIYIVKARNEFKRKKTVQAMHYLDKAVTLHIRKNKITYTGKKIKIDSNKSHIEEFDARTINEVNKYLSSAFSILDRNSTVALANVYYNISLILYKTGYTTESSAFLETAIALDPELGHLYIELANLYFYNKRNDKGLEVLVTCRDFDLPKQQCDDYLNTNVLRNNYLLVGTYKEVIFNLQKNYF